MSAVLSRGRVLAIPAALVLALALAFGTFASAAMANHLENEPGTKRVLCHSGNGKNYTSIAVDESAVGDVAGHTDHEFDFILPEPLSFYQAEFGPDIDEEVQALCEAGPPT